VDFAGNFGRLECCGKRAVGPWLLDLTTGGTGLRELDGNALIASLPPLAAMVTGEGSPAEVRRLAVAPSHADWRPPPKRVESKLGEAVHWVHARFAYSESKAGGWATAEPAGPRGLRSDGGSSPPT
jgi:hypothetical protein